MRGREKREVLTRQTLVFAIRDEVGLAATQTIDAFTVWHFERALLVDTAAEGEQ